MIERLIRANAGRLQGLYDHMPRPVQCLLTSVRGLFLTRIRYTPEMYLLLEELLLHEDWSAEQIAEMQA
ncbi:MAG TPA: hypothetical protein VI699_12150, partial [Candidatus Acidoferrales bacterium]|nr:hypothetical protein [Candidatus Acidoferrales bacterium]